MPSRSAARTGESTGTRCSVRWTCSPGCCASTCSRRTRLRSGLEIELNLVDEPACRRCATPPCSTRSPTRPGRPSWASSTWRSTCRRARWPARRWPSWKRRSGPASTRRTARPADVGSRLVMVGILPTLGELDVHEGTLSANDALQGAQRADLRGARRGHADRDRRRRSSCSPTRTASPRKPPAPACSCTSRSARTSSRTTGTPRRRSRARRSRWPPTPRSCSAGSSGRRPGSSCSSRPPTPGRMS